jgi:threonyl-tRNA synthetase
MHKVPYILVVGDKEAAANAVSVRTRSKGDGGSMPLPDFLSHAQKINADKSTEL